MSDGAAVADTPTIHATSIPVVASQLLMSDSDDRTAASATATTPGQMDTTTAGRINSSTGSSSGRTNQHGGRGRNNNDRDGGGGGRVPMGGRGLVNQGGRSGPRNTAGRGYGGRGYNNQQQQPQRMPIQVHANSGVPFGHVPAYLPGSSSLVEELDHRILLVLRDGKHIIGTLISFDQFGNLVLTNAVDRQIVSVVDKESGMKRNYYSDIPLSGLYIARGESLVLVGEVHDESNNPLMQPVTMEELGNLASNALPSLEWDFDTDLTA